MGRMGQWRGKYRMGEWKIRGKEQGDVGNMCVHLWNPNSTFMPQNTQVE